MIARSRRCICLLAGWLALAGGAYGNGVVVEKSEIGFTMKQMGAKFDGRFRNWKADVVFQPKSPGASRAVIDVDLGSVDLASAESETEARGPLWFNTAKFPVAHFASTSIKEIGGDRYEIAGKLALKGVTRDCVVPVVVTSDATGNRVASGTFALRRLDYRIGEGEWADTSTVDNDILVHVRFVLPPSG